MEDGIQIDSLVVVTLLRCSRRQCSRLAEGIVVEHGALGRKELESKESSPKVKAGEASNCDMEGL